MVRCTIGICQIKCVRHTYRTMIARLWRSASKTSFASVQLTDVATSFIFPLPLFTGHETHFVRITTVVKTIYTHRIICLNKACREPCIGIRIALDLSMQGQLENFPFLTLVCLNVSYAYTDKQSQQTDSTE